MSDDNKGNPGNWKKALKDLVFKNRYRVTAFTFAILGIMLLALWFATKDDTSTSMLLFLAGIGIISLSIMLIYFSPSRYVTDAVSDSMAISGVLSLDRMLSSLLVDPGGIYMPPGKEGLLKVFIPISRLEQKDIDLLDLSVNVFEVKGPVKGISLTPPGYGLYQHASGMGAVFTPDGLESEMKDVMENGLELASSMNIKRSDDQITIILSGLTNEGLCHSIRKTDPVVCTRVGCPVCSLMACMIVSGTGKKARIEKIDAKERTLTVVFKLL